MISKLFKTKSVWRQSPFSDLPSLEEPLSRTSRELCIIAGGLALVLSRIPPHGIPKNYAAAAELHELLTKQLRKYGKTSATADLILKVMHEVAPVADPTTVSALKRCLEMRRVFEARRRLEMGPESEQDSGGQGSGFLSRVSMSGSSRQMPAPALAPQARPRAIQVAPPQRPVELPQEPVPIAKQPELIPTSDRLKEAVNNARRQRSGAGL